MFFDTHTHLDDEQFDGLRDAVVQRAKKAGVVGMIAVGTTATASETCVSLASTYSRVYASVGIQPTYTAEATENDWDTVIRLAELDRVVAIGETGLDRYQDYVPFEVQQDFFDRHLQLSRHRELPFIVHMRECEADVLAMLGEASRKSPLMGVMHAFTGSLETARACIDMGLYISFAGMVTYKKSDALRTVAKAIPLERLLIETDCPYLSPHPVRGHRPNEPAAIVHTASCLADLHGLGVSELGRQTAENAKRLFRVELPKG